MNARVFGNRLRCQVLGTVGTHDVIVGTGSHDDETYSSFCFGNLYASRPLKKTKDARIGNRTKFAPEIRIIQPNTFDRYKNRDEIQILLVA